MTSSKILLLIIAILLVECNQGLKGDLLLPDDIEAKSLPGQTQPTINEKLAFIIQKNLELRKNLNNIMRQRKKQQAYEYFWELRRG